MVKYLQENNTCQNIEKFSKFMTHKRWNNLKNKILINYLEFRLSRFLWLKIKNLIFFQRQKEIWKDLIFKEINRSKWKLITGKDKQNSVTNKDKKNWTIHLQLLDKRLIFIIWLFSMWNQVVFLQLKKYEH